MKRINFLKRVTILTVSVLAGSSVFTFNDSSAESLESNNDYELTSIEFNTSINNKELTEAEKVEIVKENPLNEDVLSDNFDLVEATENIPSLQEMNNEENELFYSIIDEQVELADITDPKEKEIYKNSLVNFFNEESESFNNLEGLQIELENSIIEENESKKEISSHLKSFLENTTISTLGVSSAKAISNPFKGKVRISVKAAGAIFNTVIGIAVGGGVGAIQSFIIQKGKKEAGKLFTKTVVSRLKAWGAPKLALVVGVSVTTALNYLDIGTNIAKQIDKRDSKKNSGYIEIY